MEKSLLIRYELRPSQLIDELIKYWSCWDKYEEFYLTELAPSLVVNPLRGDKNERKILGGLCDLLNKDEWSALPELIAERRSGKLRELEIERKYRLQEELHRQEKEKEQHKVAKLEALKRKEEEQKRALQEEQNRQTEIKRQQLFQELWIQFKLDFLGAEKFYQAACTDLISQPEYEQEKLSFVKSWIAENIPLDSSVQRRQPDDEQAKIIGSVHGHIQVVARAGSGKTTTLVNRALFLFKHCGIALSEILVLAFNRKAVIEIHRKLLGLLDEKAEAIVIAEIDCHIRKTPKGNQRNRSEAEERAIETTAKKLKISLPRVMTFHALAYAIVHPEETPLYNDVDEESEKLSRVVQQIIDDHLQISTFKQQIQELMLAHFREDWEHIVTGGYDRNQAELLQFRRSLPKESISGEYVKSFGEKIISDFLFEHGITYKYEHNHWWNEVNYRPDFTIFQASGSGIVIEYFGLKGDTDYDEMSNSKRTYWSNKPNWRLLEFSPRDISSYGVDGFRKLIKNRLEAHGIACIQLSEDEIWYRIRDRAIDQFTIAIVGFIGRCRKLSISPSELDSLTASHLPLSKVEAMFLVLAHRFYTAYLDRLLATGEDDFDGIMQRATEAVNSGKTLYERKSAVGDLKELRCVFIDEFQDFSDLFYRLLSAIRNQNQQIQVFCVGDDWQAINGFAGSDLKFFENFTNYIGKSQRLYLSTNYRSSNTIVATGNALMNGLGKLSVAHKKSAGEVLLADLSEFAPSVIEKKRHPSDIITPAVLRLVSKAYRDNLDVVLLCRRKAVPWFVNYQNQDKNKGSGIERFVDLIRSFLPKAYKKRVSISTTHKYKGLEQAMVIVLDAVERSYPLIHPNWVFSRVLGDNLEKIIKEERRLFYVALTRAVEKLVIITDKRSKSPFLGEIHRSLSLDALNWNEYASICLKTTSLVVKVGNQDNKGITPTIIIKDLLKASGYQWKSTLWPSWFKIFPIENFNINRVKSELWAEAADGIEIRIFDDKDFLVARYIVDARTWYCDFDDLTKIITNGV